MKERYNILNGEISIVWIGNEMRKKSLMEKTEKYLEEVSKKLAFFNAMLKVNWKEDEHDKEPDSAQSGD